MILMHNRRPCVAFLAGFFIFLALLPLSAARADTEPLRVLFIGNSYTSVNNLPGMIEALATAAKEKRPLQSTAITPGGWSFHQHLLAPDTQTPTAIAQREWDFVVLQEQSQMPFLYPKVTIEHGTKLGQLIKEQKATPLLYMTWARENQPENQEAITKTYTELAKALEAPLAPVGPAWEAARKKRATLKLYTQDKSHPAPAGSYLAACVFYAKFYDRSPVGLPGRLTVKANDNKVRLLADLTGDDARFLQKIAWQTVQGMKEEKKPQ